MRKAERRYGNDGAADKELIILFLYLALHILHSYSHMYSGDILVGLPPILLKHVVCTPVSVCVCVFLTTSVVVMATLDRLTYEGVFSEVDV